MTAESLNDWRARAMPWDGLIRVAPLLLGGTAFLLALFWQEGVAATRVWYESTAYSHCFFVLPIALYILWDRRDRLRGLEAAPLPWLALGVLPVAACWLLADRMGFMEGRQLMAMTMLELMFLAVLGWRLWWVMSPGLLYLYFLVPFGAFATPWLQHFTADFIRVGLNVLGIPNYIDSFLIEIPEGSFYVAEACAGLRFLIAAIAFGTLFSILIYRSPWKRLAFMVASVIIPIIANGFRALGIVLLGHILGSAQAGAADHIIYGWLFFSVVILLLILAGMPFREDLPDPAAARPAPPPAAPVALRPVGLAVGLACVLAAAGPVATLAMTLGDQPPRPAAPPLFTAIPPCAPTPALAAAPAWLAPGRGSVARFACGPIRLTVTVLAFPSHSTRAPIRADQTRLGPGGDEVQNSTLTVPNAEPPAWQLVESSDMLRATASAVWIGGAPARGGVRARLEQARDSVLGASLAPVLVVMDAELPIEKAAGQPRQAPRALLQAFLAAQYDLGAQVRRFAGAALGR